MDFYNDDTPAPFSTAMPYKSDYSFLLLKEKNNRTSSQGCLIKRYSREQKNNRQTKKSVHTKPTTAPLNSVYIWFNRKPIYEIHTFFPGNCIYKKYHCSKN